MFLRYDGEMFATLLQEEVHSQRRRNRGDRKLRWVTYCDWAYALKVRYCYVKKFIKEFTERVAFLILIRLPKVFLWLFNIVRIVMPRAVKSLLEKKGVNVVCMFPLD